MIWTAITCEKISKTVWSLSCTTDMGAVTETSSSGSQKQTVANKLCGNLQLLAFITDQVIRFIHHFYQEKPWGKKNHQQNVCIKFWSTDGKSQSCHHKTCMWACCHVVLLLWLKCLFCASGKDCHDHAQSKCSRTFNDSSQSLWFSTTITALKWGF